MARRKRVKEFADPDKSLLLEWNDTLNKQTKEIKRLQKQVKELKEDLNDDY